MRSPAIRFICTDALALFFAALVLFSYHLDNIGKPIFDETYYAAAAYQWLHELLPTNLEHPPLGKLLISAGIAVFGSNAFGWRITGAIFGALTVAATYVLGRQLFSERRSAWVCAALTLVNGVLFVQARIAMLDVYMVCLLLWAAVAGHSVVERPSSLRRVMAFGVLGGLAVAAKEFAVLPVAVLATCFGVAVASNPQIRGRRRLFLAATALVCAATAYLATFMPYLFAAKYRERTSLDVIVSLQNAIWKYQWLEIRARYDHPYRSEWWQWVLQIRPIWFYYGTLAGDSTRAQGVMMMGNPLITLGGIPAVAYCGYLGLKERARVACALVAMYGALTICWPFLARKEAYYYYYFPAVMVMSFIVAFVLRRLSTGLFCGRPGAKHLDVAFVACSTALFAFFYPVYAGQVILDADFMRWIWLPSWY